MGSGKPIVPLIERGDKGETSTIIVVGTDRRYGAVRLLIQV